MAHALGVGPEDAIATVAHTLARACTLAPDAVADLKPLMQRAERRVADTSKSAADLHQLFLQRLEQCRNRNY